MRLEKTTKRKYVKPTIEVIAINFVEGMLQTVSLEKRDDEYATGGGDAKAYNFYDETEDNQHWKWGKGWED